MNFWSGKGATGIQSQELCHEFYSTYEFDEVYMNDELKTKKIIKFRLGSRAYNLTLLEFARRRNPVLRVLHKVITYGLCQRTTSRVYRELEIPKSLKASMHNLYERMSNMEICQGVIERMSYRQSYHKDMYAGVFEHMAEVYSVDMPRAYNPPGYAQPQYDQYYQQYPPQPLQ
nr:hypothetical protein [Tanacetum cinerariifolium]